MKAQGHRHVSRGIAVASDTVAPREPEHRPPPASRLASWVIENRPKATPPPLCGCGHLHMVGDDEGADAGCEKLAHGCDCWNWHP